MVAMAAGAVFSALTAKTSGSRIFALGILVALAGAALLGLF